MTLTLATLLLFGIERRCVALDAPALKRQIDAPKVFEREIVLVSDKPDEEEVRALASSLHADVTRVGECWQLFRSGSTHDGLVKADRDWVKRQAESAGARIDALSQRYAKSPVDAPFDALRAAQARFEARADQRVDFSAIHANELMPASQLLVDFIRRMPAGALRDVAPGSATVFSNAPVGPEFPLEASPSALKTYVAAQEAFARRFEDLSSQGKILDKYRSSFPSGPFAPGPRTFQLWIA